MHTHTHTHTHTHHIHIHTDTPTHPHTRDATPTRRTHVQASRLDLGGVDCAEYMRRLLQQKLPDVHATVGEARAKELVDSHTYAWPRLLWNPHVVFSVLLAQLLCLPFFLNLFSPVRISAVCFG
jgi:hypothetical protein